jgi:hypothetical protein
VSTLQHVAAAYRTHQALIARAAAERAGTAWDSLDPADLSGSWAASVGPATRAALTAAQQLAAAGTHAYIGAAMAAQDADAPADATVSPPAFAGTAADGRDLASLLYLPIIDSKIRIAAGMPVADAMLFGRTSLTRIIATETADAGRDALQAGMTATGTVHDYVRLVAGTACSRCILLAGKHYRWNASFQRHPRCSCTAVPAAGGAAALATDPHTLFDHLTAAQQDARFGAADAQAIREGADIYQVVNAHRGIYTAGDVYGHTLELTSEGVTKRGLAGKRLIADRKPGGPTGLRLTVREIYRQAGDDRPTALSLLRKYGYIR